MSAASTCFRNAGQRVAAGLPFCHPNDPCNHDYHRYEVTEPNGMSLTLADGSSIPLHTSWALCPDHEGEYA